MGLSYNDDNPIGNKPKREIKKGSEAELANHDKTKREKKFQAEEENGTANTRHGADISPV